VSDACKKHRPIVFDSVLPPWHSWAIPQCVEAGKLFCSRSQVEPGTTWHLCRSRSWYRHKIAPSHLDVVWTCREALHEASIFPLPRFPPDLAENHEELEPAVPLAA
jgi:hypothetical protein